MLPARKRSTIAAVWWWVSRVSCATGGTSAAVVSASRLPSASPTSALSTWLSSRFPLPAQGENPLALPCALWRLGLDDASDASSSRSRCSLRPRALIPDIMEFIPIKPLAARGGGAPGRCAGHSRSPSRERTPSYHRATRVHRAARSWSCTVRIMGMDRPKLLRPPYQVYWGTLYC